MSQRDDLIAYAIQAAQRVGFPDNVLVAQLDQESGFNPDAHSPAGAEGVGQFMPQTAAGLGINPWEPYQSIDAAAQLDADNLAAFGSIELALAAYNAGGGAVKKYGGIPPFPETQRYVLNIMAAAGQAPSADNGGGTSSAGTGPPPGTDRSGLVLLGMAAVALYVAGVL